MFIATPYRWGEKCVSVKGISTGLPSVSEIVNHIVSPSGKTSREPDILQPLVWHIFQKLLKMKLGPLHLMKTLMETDEAN